MTLKDRGPAETIDELPTNPVVIYKHFLFLAEILAKHAPAHPHIEKELQDFSKTLVYLAGLFRILQMHIDDEPEHPKARATVYPYLNEVYNLRRKKHVLTPESYAEIIKFCTYAISLYASGRDAKTEARYRALIKEKLGDM